MSNHTLHTALARRLELPVSALLERLTAGALHSGEVGTALATGFQPLDKALEGGLRRTDLLIMGGAPGSGKTIACLQWARAIALAGGRVLFLCYEHDVETLFGRLLACEVGSLGVDFGPEDTAVAARVLDAVMTGVPIPEHGDLDHPVLRASLAQLDLYADRLILAQVSAQEDHIEKIRERVMGTEDPYDAVFVDYLQKVPSIQNYTGVDRYTHTVEHLKDMALSERCLMAAVSSVDAGALGARRLQLSGFRAAHALAHEADVVITLNPKLQVVSRSHLAFDTTRHEEFRRAVVFTIEKNRRGVAPLDLEFDKDFERYRFQPTGRFVAEQLVDDLVVKD